MMIELPADMNKLLDKVLVDLPQRHISLYDLLDTPEFTNHFEDFDLDDNEPKYVLFKDFVASVIAYFDINYGSTLYKHLFAAVVMDIFGDMEDWGDIDPFDFEERKENLMEGLKDITFQTLPHNHLDYDMVYTMLEDKLL